MGKHYWIDSHAHLTDSLLYDKIHNVLGACGENDVQRILTICLSFEELEKAYALKEKDDRIDIAMGLFPTEYHLHSEENFKRLEEVARDPRIVALGEMGLDYYWEKDTEKRELQKGVLKRQIALAKKVAKPVLIHSRDAAKDTLDILKEVQHVGVMHCYSYSLELAKEFIQCGYYLSFAGPVTFKNAREPKEVAKWIPMNKILLETDSPYLTPEPHRGEKNQPAYVKHIGEMICELKGIEVAQLQEAVRMNYESLMNHEN